MSDTENDALIKTTARIVGAYVSNNAVPGASIAELIFSVSAAMGGLSDKPSQNVEVPAPRPAVDPRKSVHPDYIISLENGGKYRSLKRHLSARYGLSPEKYRTKWNLPSDYPMVAANYSLARSELAKSNRFGRNPEPVIEPKKSRRAVKGTDKSASVKGSKRALRRT